MESEHRKISYKNKSKFYEELCSEMTALLDPDPLANLANASALLYFNLPDINWSGFYLLKSGELVLGPFQGKTACTRIALNLGVCGAAATQKKTQLVKDVHTFPGHIACDSASRSEIVVPLMKDGQVWGVLDIDSPTLARFDEEDQKGLEKFSSLFREI